MRSRWLLATCLAVLLAVFCLVSAHIAGSMLVPTPAAEADEAKKGTAEEISADVPEAPALEPMPVRQPLIIITHEPEEDVSTSPDVPPKQEDVNAEENAAPKLALIIDDFGYSRSIAARILALKLCATWAIIPDAPHASEIARLAEKNGQPYILHIPMQALEDPGGGRDYLIGTDTPEKKIAAVVAALKQRFPKAIGANNHRGSKATSHPATMRSFMKAFAETGWGFIDSRTSPRSIAKRTAEEYHIPVAHNEVFIDGTPDLNTMKRQFAKALRIAKKRGSAVAICHTREKTLPFLAFVSTQKAGPVRLVWADEVWKRRTAAKEEKQ